MPKLNEGIMFQYHHILVPRISVRLCISPRKPSKTVRTDSRFGPPGALNSSPEEQQASISRSEAPNKFQQQKTAPKASQPGSKQCTSGILSPYGTAWTPTNLPKISEHRSDYKEAKQERSPSVCNSDVREKFI